MPKGKQTIDKVLVPYRYDKYFREMCDALGVNQFVVLDKLGIPLQALYKWAEKGPTPATHKSITAYFEEQEKLVEQKRVEEKQMAREILTDEQVELEIARLREDPYVKLAKAEERIRYRRRQYLYGLRNLEKKGKAMAAAGLTLEMLRDMGEEELV